MVANLPAPTQTGQGCQVTLLAHASEVREETAHKVRDRPTHHARPQTGRVRALIREGIGTTFASYLRPGTEDYVIKYACPRCKKELVSSRWMAGRRLKCTDCGKRSRVPGSRGPEVLSPCSLIVVWLCLLAAWCGISWLLGPRWMVIVGWLVALCLWLACWTVASGRR
jgi:DNA-directed RNA polymerase subunit RPC12/RpoP